MRDEESRFESRYRLLRDAMSEGFCVVEVLFDADGKPQDGILREVNRAYELQTGRVQAVGRRISELAPDLQDAWIQAFGGVARTGQPARFEQRAATAGKWYEVHAFRWGESQQGLVGVLFNDITQRKLDELMAQSVLDYAIVLLDPAGHVRSWNAGAQRIKGYTPEEIVGRSSSVFYLPEDAAAGRPARVLALAAESGRYEEEGWRVRRDGSRFWASVSVAPLHDSDGRLQGFVKVTRDLSERKSADDGLRAEVHERMRAQEQLHALNERLEAEVAARTADLTRANTDLLETRERLRELSARLIRAHEQERGRIARDFHDGTGQFLALLRMRLADLSRDVGEARVQPSTELVKQVIDHTRRLGLILRPIALDDLGLEAALESMVEQQAALTGWSATYDGALGERRFADEVETACFRIAQEALTNAARYADASEVRVSLAIGGEELVLQVADNGRGFDVEHYQTPEERATHFGLVSMEERAGLVGARLSIDSAPGRGTRVTAHFPLEARPG
ncbi:PAS domain S-box protein [Ramlibacter alkalitolerans]|uniref:histidine kinase n=1 Tax=Ramlibacter alkalitolerans TaxID=2039631 RepID=A0ABS1JGZ4_9BURK|nr:PAS domain S-box protein [Ramlibacter alkalitolerans]MBL0423498.1 PAS domain S-box protein [Ramlibacter alkalitolerans]